MGAGQQLRTMKGGVATKLCLIVFLPTILVLWDDKGTLAGSVPQMHDNNQFPKFLVLDKPGGKKSLIEIEGKTGRKESVQKQTDHDYSDVKCSFEGKEYMPGVTRYCDCTFCKCLETGDWKPTIDCNDWNIFTTEPSSNNNEGSADGIADLSEPDKDSGHKSRTPDCYHHCNERLYHPVCGSDGKTYTNKCVLEEAVACIDGKQDLVVASEGECSDSGARMMNG